MWKCVFVCVWVYACERQAIETVIIVHSLTATRQTDSQTDGQTCGRSRANMVRPGKYFQFPLQKCTTRVAERKRGREDEEQRIALFSSIMKIKFFISMHSHWTDRSGQGRTDGGTDSQTERALRRGACVARTTNECGQKIVAYYCGALVGFTTSTHRRSGKPLSPLLPLMMLGLSRVSMCAIGWI